ncbi:MAG TPA: hypothetical protein VHT34_10865 [Clostridia bacterium]|nr:hypothetical protein [Clostridia bacterium]
MNTTQISINARGRITSLWKEQLRTDCLIQGVKQADQYEIERNSRIRGSNGTYLEIGEYYGTALYINVTVYDPPVIEYCNKSYQVPERFCINCYEAAREAIDHKAFGKLAVFDKDIDELQKYLVGKKTDIHFCIQQEIIEDDILKVIALLPIKIKSAFPFYGIINATGTTWRK